MIYMIHVIYVIYKSRTKGRKNTSDGALSPLFQKQFASLRMKHLPNWADQRQFNHYYRFALNTSIPYSEAGKTLHVGDALCIQAESEV